MSPAACSPLPVLRRADVRPSVLAEPRLRAVVGRALLWSLGLVLGVFGLWFASNVIAPIPATAATREVQLASAATSVVAAGPPDPQPAGLFADGGDEPGGDSGGDSGGSDDGGSGGDSGGSDDGGSGGDDGGSDDGGSGGDDGGSDDAGSSGDDGGSEQSESSESSDQSESSESRSSRARPAADSRDTEDRGDQQDGDSTDDVVVRDAGGDERDEEASPAGGWPVERADDESPSSDAEPSSSDESAGKAFEKAFDTDRTSFPPDLNEIFADRARFAEKTRPEDSSPAPTEPTRDHEFPGVDLEFAGLERDEAAVPENSEVAGRVAGLIDRTDELRRGIEDFAAAQNDNGAKPPQTGSDGSTADDVAATGDDAPAGHGPPGAPGSGGRTGPTKPDRPETAGDDRPEGTVPTSSNGEHEPSHGDEPLPPSGHDNAESGAEVTEPVADPAGDEPGDRHRHEGLDEIGGLLRGVADSLRGLADGLRDLFGADGPAADGHDEHTPDGVGDDAADETGTPDGRSDGTTTDPAAHEGGPTETGVDPAAADVVHSSGRSDADDHESTGGQERAVAAGEQLDVSGVEDPAGAVHDIDGAEQGGDDRADAGPGEAGESHDATDGHDVSGVVDTVSAVLNGVADGLRDLSEGLHGLGELLDSGSLTPDEQGPPQRGPKDHGGDDTSVEPGTGDDHWEVRPESHLPDHPVEPLIHDDPSTDDPPSEPLVINPLGPWSRHSPQVLERLSGPHTDEEPVHPTGDQDAADTGETGSDGDAANAGTPVPSRPTITHPFKKVELSPDETDRLAGPSIEGTVDQPGAEHDNSPEPDDGGPGAVEQSVADAPTPATDEVSD